ncbi:uncharacterized protein LOC110021384 [Phalaenopsis equestris]|uniref:uncharacterized protein LOC110021384 n=1 Tax=Phalaenopsis equestris TaxID=78828 RepID=UPI0009E26219|nr:uncharacterized protein LOC110021384 [Phalaenopsis equestris]
MSASSTAFPPHSSLTKQKTRRFASIISNRSRPESPLFGYLPAFPCTVHPYRRLLLYQSKPIFSRKSARRWIGALFSDEAIGDVHHRDQGELSLDAFLSAAEILCILPPSIFSISCLLGLVIPGASKLFQISLGNQFFVWQFFFLVSAVAIGGLLRRRQWRRICGENQRASGVDLIARIEKVEQDMKSSATISRVLSKQLEKLSIRFRVTKKALKDPIAETAALAKKNSEVTRALAIQEDTLEKELVEIQRVLLAMQEQQQKQLELILAIGKAGKLFESKKVSGKEGVPAGSGFPFLGKKESQELEVQSVDNNRI